MSIEQQMELLKKALESGAQVKVLYYKDTIGEAAEQIQPLAHLAEQDFVSKHYEGSDWVEFESEQITVVAHSYGRERSA